MLSMNVRTYVAHAHAHNDNMRHKLTTIFAYGRFLSSSSCSIHLSCVCVCTYSHTQGYSMTSNALLVCRVSSPIAFNFINMTHIKNTTFEHNIGAAIDSTPILGKGFNDLLPFILVPYMLLVACGFFNVVASFLTRNPEFKVKEDYDLLGAGRSVKFGNDDNGNIVISSAGADGSGGSSIFDGSDTEDPILKRGYELINIEFLALQNGILGSHVDVAASKGTSPGILASSASRQPTTSREPAPTRTRSQRFDDVMARAKDAVARVQRKNNSSGSRSSGRPTFSFLRHDEEAGSIETTGLLR